LLRKRSVIETVNDELKNICKIEHTRHRSISGFLLNNFGAIAAYSLDAYSLLAISYAEVKKLESVFCKEKERNLKGFRSEFFIISDDNETSLKKTFFDPPPNKQLMEKIISLIHE
jgi:hypothetical protein